MKKIDRKIFNEKQAKWFLLPCTVTASANMALDLEPSMLRPWGLNYFWRSLMELSMEVIVVCGVFTYIYNLLLELWTRSFIRNSHISKTSPIPVSSSLPISWFVLVLRPSIMASFLFNLTQMTKGNPNLSLYCEFKRFNSVFSCGDMESRLAADCSRQLSLVSWPAWANFPARSGWTLRIPAFTKIFLRGVLFSLLHF